MLLCVINSGVHVADADDPQLEEYARQSRVLLSSDSLSDSNMYRLHIEDPNGLYVFQPRWRCQYHIVFAPKYRRQAIYGEIKADIGFILRKLCEQKGIEIIEAQACEDHIHTVLHSDQSSVYASKAFNELLPMYNITRSMSRAGTPTDNAAMEAINGWVKAELFMDFHVTDNEMIEQQINDYVLFFNEQRPPLCLELSDT